MPRLSFCLCLVLLLSACSASPGSEGESTPPLAALTPYVTLSPSPAYTQPAARTEVQLPTPTPLEYVIAAGDTLEAIAARYGVTLEALLAANPGIQPNLLIVGTPLVIPTGTLPQGESTPTPAALPLLQARCWPEGTGGLWCFALLQNGYAEALENLTVLFTLVDADGQVLATREATAPLNLLPAGEKMPIGAHFPAPIDLLAVPHVQVLTATRLLPGDARYLPVMLENTLLSLNPGGRSAQVSGRVLLTQPEPGAATLWVLAVAYDRDGTLVGFRRYKGMPFTAAEGASFDFLVSSLGPAIDHVELLLEARP